MKQKTIDSKLVYASPQTEFIPIEMEQCIAASKTGNTLGDMSGNGIYDEGF